MKYFMIVEEAQGEPRVYKGKALEQSVIPTLLTICAGNTIGNVAEMVLVENGLFANNIVIGSEVFPLEDFVACTENKINKMFSENSEKFSVTIELYADQIRLTTIRFTMQPEGWEPQ